MGAVDQMHSVASNDEKDRLVAACDAHGVDHRLIKVVGRNVLLHRRARWLHHQC